MVIINSYAKNENKKGRLQKQRIGYNTMEEAMKNIEETHNLLEKQYNEFLVKNNLGKIKKEVVREGNKIIATFSNENIGTTQYFIEFEE